MTEKRLYDSVRWRKERKLFLDDPEHCLCVMCEREGREVPATVVDHSIPHHGDSDLFWNWKNWQGLCANHHSGHKRQQELSGFHGGCDVDGLPLDANHPWGRK